MDTLYSAFANHPGVPTQADRASALAQAASCHDTKQLIAALMWLFMHQDGTAGLKPRVFRGCRANVGPLNPKRFLPSWTRAESFEDTGNNMLFGVVRDW